MTPDTPTKKRFDSGQRLLLFLLTLTQFMLVLDVAIVSVALPRIQQDLGFGVANLQWVVSAYALTFAGFLILGGRVGDLFGRKKVFLAGVSVFTVASLAAGMAVNPIMLIVARGLQGLGGAFASPAALSLLTTNFAEGDDRNRALGVWGAVAAGGASAGVLIGGLLTDLLDWRWVFFVNVPIGVALVLASLPKIRESLESGAARNLDVAGAVTITGSLTALVFAISRLESESITDSVVVQGSLTVGLILLAVFIVVELRSDQPLVPFRIFKSRRLTAANVIEMLNSAVIVGVSFFISLYLQQVLGFSPLTTGIALLPTTLAVMVVANVVPRLLGRVDVKTIIVTGSTVMTIAMLTLSRVKVDGAYLTDVFGPLLLVGIALGFTFTGALVAATSGVENEYQGLASGILNTSQQVGFSLGIAVLAFAAASRTLELSDLDSLEALNAGFQRAFLIAASFGLMATVLALLVLPNNRSTGPQPHPSQATPKETN